MYETQVTVQGHVGTPVKVKDVGDVQVASFRLASTPRRFDKNVNSWVDQETNWFTVNAWRSLAKHCLESLAIGDPVVVYGRLTCQSWTNAEGEKQFTFVLDAISAGHDLTKGTSRFEKMASGKATDGTVESALGELNSLMSETAGQVTSDGQPVDSPAA